MKFLNQNNCQVIDGELLDDYPKTISELNQEIIEGEIIFQIEIKSNIYRNYQENQIGKLIDVYV